MADGAESRQARSTGPTPLRPGRYAWLDSRRTSRTEWIYVLLYVPSLPQPPAESDFSLSIFGKAEGDGYWSGRDRETIKRTPRPAL